MTKIRLVSCLVWAMTLLCSVSATAFVGSDLTSGQKYYLFNIYQSKFLGADNKLQAPNIGTPLAFTASASGFTIGGTAYTATKNAAGYYQLKNGSNFFAFEDKVDDPDNPTDENRRMYLGGGVLCKNTTNDTDRSYWQLISETEYAEWQAKKKFTVASLNVDGMPKSVSLLGQSINLNPDATEGPGAEEIGRHLLASGFDVVGVSENFNFHSNIWNIAWNGGTGNHYNAMTHRGEISVANATLTNYLSKKPLFDMDGLNVYYRIDGATTVAQPSNESWTQWNDHNGYTDEGGDGLIKKGFRYYLVTLADGTTIDLYSMHMDADDGQADRDARSSQLKQLVTYIKAHNNGRPIVIIGDSNCRYTRDTVKEDLIDALNADENYTIRDPWIQFGRNNSYPAKGSGAIMAETEGYRSGEVVDKIWYVNNKQSNIRLVAETYHQDLSFVASQDVAGTALKQGSPLCDHKPCVVTFSYHQYDPVIDDVAIVETSEEAVYLRNRETGRYLMNGGWWGSHAVVGNYGKPYYVKSLANGKYSLESAYGHITDAAYVDNNNAAEYINEWTILEEDGYKVFSYNQGGTMKALTANDPTYFNDNPLYRYVTTAPLNVSDKLQQWEIVTQTQMAEEMAKATPMNPVNATHLIKSANFDRIDWNEHSAWTYGGTKSKVTDQGIHGNDNTPFDNHNRGFVTGADRSTDNTWDLYQVLTVPAGYYVISCQGFLQEGSNSNSSNVKFYAWSNPNGSYKEVSQAIANYLSVDESARPTSQNQSSAADAFNNGLYQNTLKEIILVGNDNKLVIGVKKDVKTSSNATWTCVDNFQLIYLGTEAPESTYYLENVESGMYLTSGYDFDARAVLSTTGKAWTPKYLSSGLSLVCDGKGDNLGIATDGVLGTFVDWRNAEPWHTEVDANGAITLEQANKRGNFLGWTSESHGDFVCDRSQLIDRELNDAIHWKALTASQYSSRQSTAAARKAAVDIYRAATISGVDTEDFAAAWHNPNTSASDITAKANALKTALEAAAAANASDDKAYNYSHYIVNATCGDEAHTGWAKTGDWGSQLGVNYGYTTNGLWLAPRFYEAWDANVLSNRKISQTISNLPAGFYKLALDVNAEKQGSNDAVIGTMLYAKAGSAERVTTACDTHGDGVIIKTFETPEFMVNADESVEIGLSLENTNANWVAFDNWQLIYLGPIYTANMTVTEGKYATFVAPFEVTIPEGVTAYTATLDGTTVNLTAVTSPLPAGTPVILGGSAVNHNFKGKRPTDTIVTDGTLVGFYWNFADDNSCVINGDGHSYVLQTQNGKQAFYKVKEETTFKGTANRCYLVTPMASEAKVLSFQFDDEGTAVEKIEDGRLKMEDCIYDLSGRRVLKAQKGIYIINGRKVMK